MPQLVDLWKMGKATFCLLPRRSSQVAPIPLAPRSVHSSIILMTFVTNDRFARHPDDNGSATDRSFRAFEIRNSFEIVHAANDSPFVRSTPYAFRSGFRDKNHKR